MQELRSQESWGDFWDKEEFFPEVKKQHISVEGAPELCKTP